MSAFFQWPLTRYSSGFAGLNVSIYRSSTSAPLFVNPHAIRSLCPMTTIGEPGKSNPFTFHPGAVRCTSYQMDGSVSSRCVSFASNGLRVAACSPLTTQLLLPRDFLMSRGDLSSHSLTFLANTDVRSACPPLPALPPLPAPPSIH